MANTEDDRGTVSAMDSIINVVTFCVAVILDGPTFAQLAVWKVTHLLPHSVKRAILGTITITLPRSIGVRLMGFLIPKQDVRDWTED